MFLIFSCEKMGFSVYLKTADTALDLDKFFVILYTRVKKKKKFR